MEFFNFSRTETVKHNQKKKKIENYSKPPKLVSQSLFKQFQKIPNIPLVFYLNSEKNKKKLETI